MTDQNPTLHDLIDRLRSVRKLDAVYDVADKVAGWNFRGRAKLRAALQGDDSLGAPIHPALVHLPIGAAVTAATLDLVGLKAASGVATGVALAGAAPSALTGLADLEFFDGSTTQRVAGAHFLAAASGNALAAVSLVARLSGNQGIARLALWGCCATYGAAGALGGYLASAPSDPPEEATDQTHATGDEPDPSEPAPADAAPVS